MLIPIALGSLGLTNSYLIWLGVLSAGTVLYFLIGRNSPYFQLRAQGLDVAEARDQAAARSHMERHIKAFGERIKRIAPPDVSLV